VTGEGQERSRGCPSWRKAMANSFPKSRMSCSRDIPLSQLVLSQSNVRRVKCGVFLCRPNLQIYDFSREFTPYLANRSSSLMRSVGAASHADSLCSGEFSGTIYLGSGPIKLLA
jgi:hypothetical protein